MIKEIKPPELVDIQELYKNKIFILFLAGSIENDSAIHWQLDFNKKLSKQVNELSRKKIVLFNPRRENWDKSWTQESEEMKTQINWEMNSMDHADEIVMYFDPQTKSPITLLELGLHANSNKLVVCCEKPFWRKGNVDIVCDRFSIPMVNDLDELVDRTLQKFVKFQLKD